MFWQQKILKKYIREVVLTSIFSVTLILIIILTNHFFGWHFEWKEIEPIDIPPIWVPYLLSAITFMTLGRFLFETYFYKILYEVMRFFGSSYRKYERAKRKIWYGLMFITAFIFIPWIIDIINSILSFFFNILQFLISIWYFIGISLGIMVIIFLFYIYISEKDPFIIRKE